MAWKVNEWTNNYRDIERMKVEHIRRMGEQERGRRIKVRPAWWLLYTGLALYALAAASGPIVEWVRHDIRTGQPRAHFYTEHAWNNCAAMKHEANAQGARYWSCHNPVGD